MDSTTASEMERGLCGFKSGERHKATHARLIAECALSIFPLLYYPEYRVYAQLPLTSGSPFAVSPPVRPADSLAQTIIGDFKGTRRSVVDVAAQLSASRIPVGVEAVKVSEGFPINFDLKNATVADVLNAAVRADPRYRWTESDGVINLLPKNDANSVFNITVEHFEAINEMPAQIIHQLVRTRKVKKYLDDRDVQAGTLTAGSFLSTPGAPAAAVRNSVVVDNETLRQALNEVLIKTGSVYWCGFYDQPNGKKYLYFNVW